MLKVCPYVKHTLQMIVLNARDVTNLRVYLHFRKKIPNLTLDFQVYNMINVHGFVHLEFFSLGKNTENTI